MKKIQNILKALIIILLIISIGEGTSLSERSIGATPFGEKETEETEMAYAPIINIGGVDYPFMDVEARENIDDLKNGVYNYQTGHGYVPNVNLVKNDFIVSGYWINANGEIVASDTSKIIMLPVIEGRSLCFSLGINIYLASGNVGGVLYLDKNKEIVSVENIGSHRSDKTYNDNGYAVFNIPSGVAYFAMTVKLATTWDATNTLTAVYAKSFDTYTGEGKEILQWDNKYFSDQLIRSSLGATYDWMTPAVAIFSGKFVNASGAIVDYSDPTYQITDFIPVSGMQKIKASGGTVFWNAIVAFFDTEKNLVQIAEQGTGTSTPDTIENKQFVVPDDAAYVIVAGRTTYPPKCEAYGLKTNPATLRNSNLQEKKVTVIGDSITEQNSTASTNWAKYLEKSTGAEVQNLGVSGTGFYYSSPYIDRISSIDSDSDIIGVAISFNDIGHGLDVGQASDTGNETICGYVNAFFDALQTAFPATPIICYCQGPWASYRYTGENHTCDVYVTEIGKICALKSIPFYDDLYFKGSALRPWVVANQNVYYKNENDGTLDSTHPNSEGHKIIANYLIPKFEQNIANVN